MNQQWKAPSAASSRSSSQRSNSSSTGDTQRTSASASSGKSQTSAGSASELLQPEDVHAALKNMLFPRNCDTLCVLGQDSRSLAEYPGVLKLKVVYSLMVEQRVKQFKASMVLKQQPRSVEGQRLFGRELAFYRHVDPQLRHVMVQTMQSPVPRSYLTRGHCEVPKHRNPSMPFHKGAPEPGCDVSAPSVLILQDLSVDGFRPAHQQPEMDYRHCSAALRALAVLHGSSAVVDRSDPKLKRGSYLKTAFPFLVPDRCMTASQESLYERGMRMIGALGPHMEPQHLLPGRDVSKVVRFLQRHLHRLIEDILTPHPEQLNTLCHTNCMSASNLQFIQDQRHRPVQCKLIGLGQVRYCRPAVDIALILFCAADREVRASKVSLLVEVYREEFNNTLEKCQRKHHSALPTSVGLLSASHLAEALMETKLLGVAMRAMIVATEFGAAKKGLSDEEAAVREFSKNKQYRSRATEAVRDLMETIEPYIGDCWLASEHKQCPHHTHNNKFKPNPVLLAKTKHTTDN
ncbi:Hypothetical predicted protein [Cloeon dipterum]|uniref:CHK kinase-like domain-containing protein n=1 Tax=Cloeon dipterum TaxID=197152 RepID=A0A8S1DI55_9INSE|nr:Hypothetical predicted protein [Cloeon dipterum]